MTTPWAPIGRVRLLLTRDCLSAGRVTRPSVEGEGALWFSLSTSIARWASPFVAGLRLPSAGCVTRPSVGEEVLWFSCCLFCEIWLSPDMEPRSVEQDGKMLLVLFLARPHHLPPTPQRKRDVALPEAC